MQEFPEAAYSRQTTVLEAMARYKWLVAGITIAFAALGFAVGYLREPTYEAAATLVLEEPTESLISEALPTTQRQFEQFLAEQEELLTSVATAERAAELAADDLPEAELSAEEIWDDVTTSSDVNTGFVEVFFTASTSDTAVLGANSVARAYEDVRLEQIREQADAQLASIDAALELLSRDLQEVQSDIETTLPPERGQLDAQLDAALSELVDLQERRLTATGAELEQIRAQLDDLFAELQTSSLYRTLEAEQPDIAQLLTREQDLLELEQELANQRQLVQIERELADSGVVLFSPAQRGELLGVGVLPLTMILAVLGLVVGGFLAYYLALRKQKVSTPHDPELVLGSPLLAEIPVFASERIRSALPVTEDPDSTVAESFRFLASSITVRHVPRARESSGASHVRRAEGSVDALGRANTLAVVSATLGDGKTTVVANTALAAARAGNRVLAIDGDFNGQHLVQLFVKESNHGLGLTDVVLRDIGVSRSVVTVDNSSGGQLDVMGRGTVDIAAGNFFRDERLGPFFADVRLQYDLVIIDTPPLLQVAYTGLLVRLVDGAIVVVRHDSEFSELQEVRDRLAMTGTSSIGYAYNGAPLRRRLAGPEGSLGEDGFSP